MHYSYPNFNRASELRLETQLNYYNDLVLLLDGATYVSSNEEQVYDVKWFPLSRLELKKESLLFLGIDDDKKQLWGADFDDVINSTDLLLETITYDIRKVFNHVNDKDKALLTYASGLLKWNQRTNYCGVCGVKTYSEDFGHSRICNNENCKNIFYPQISPAIIALVEYHPENAQPKCLLQTRDYNGKMMCSTFAGFVEVGESLEDGVKRELKEEVAVKVTNMKYITSQPWSFSSSLMIGYHAQVDCEYYDVDGVEIKNARWFTADELKDLLKNDKIQLSLPDSIARYIIELWINKNL
ncbi:NAD(+) diphosphatase [Winogradskyella sp.]